MTKYALDLNNTRMSDKAIIPPKILILTDEDEIRAHVRIPDLQRVIWEFSQYLREQIKYGTQTPESIEKVNEQWHEIAKENNIDPFGVYEL